MTMPCPATALSAESGSGWLPSVDAIDIEPLRRNIALPKRKLKAGEYLYRIGQPFARLYLVKSGSLKTCELSTDGREQVTGFRMRGELLGMESIGLAGYACDVVALEDSEVWCIAWQPILDECRIDTALRSRLTEVLANEIRRQRAWMLTIGTLSAEHRVAAFLIDLADRHAQLGDNPNHFELHMVRADIASFLALSHETVTRALTRLTRRGLILVLRREIRLLDIAQLGLHAGVAPTLH